MKDPRWFAYMVRCSDRSLYCGATPDLERRVRMHNEGRGARYTRGRGPVKLAWAELFDDKSGAMIAEAGVKSLSKARKEAMVGEAPDPDRRERTLLLWAHMSMGRRTPVPMAEAERSTLVPTVLHHCFTRFSWAIATEEAILQVASLSPIVEMGAGTGYWAGLLRRAGADVVALDRCGKGSPLPLNMWNVAGRTYSKVVYGTPESLRAHGDRTLFLCWPPSLGTMAEDCLDNWSGTTIAYVGDFRGVTASERFYDRLQSEFRRVLHVPIPQWVGANDSLTVWKRRARVRRVVL